ncbi:MAG: [Clostridia bacterium]|nr:[FeFe] hydrogenase H-cluster maturation GTPase HydF [Clostridia bacterium]
MEDRKSIGFFGCRNVGKSSLVNAVTNQEMSVVSNIKGTTTDAVKKSMEILPLGKVLIIDTPGFDDNGELGRKRVEATKKILRNCDIAVLVTEAGRNLNSIEENLILIFKDRDIPFLIVKNKSDKILKRVQNNDKEIYTSAINKTGIEELKKAIGEFLKDNSKTKKLIGDLIKENDIVVLVTPIDNSAPKDRLILPQQLSIRDIIDGHGIVVVTRETELEETLKSLGRKPVLVITDSQVFNKVSKIVPEDIYLTSFSILMARYKGFLEPSVKGAKTLDLLKDGSKILISEGCTHHRQCYDIGTVKLPNWIRKYTGKNFEFDWTSGNDFAEKIENYDLVIHCGGCMLNSNEMQYRLNLTIQKNIPFTNYGIVIAYINGILEKSLNFLAL